MKKLIYSIAMLIFSVNINAQTPQVPSGKPGKVPLANPALHPLKPDLIISSYRVVSVTEDTSRHIFETRIIITYKNNGPGNTATTYTVDLRSRFGTTSGGTDYSRIGSPGRLQLLAPGKSKSVLYVFAKDVTAMGRARLECVLRIDPDNIIEETNEDNNLTPFFYITPPRH